MCFCFKMKKICDKEEANVENKRANTINRGLKITMCKSENLIHKKVSNLSNNLITNIRISKKKKLFGQLKMK